MKYSKGIWKNLLAEGREVKLAETGESLSGGWIKKRKKEESHRSSGRSCKGVGTAVKIKCQSDFSSANFASDNAPPLVNGSLCPDPSHGL